MSLVGPRPEFPELYAELISLDSRFARRQVAKPGITGLAQIFYRHAHTNAQAVKRIGYDMTYIKHASLMVDVSLCYKTLIRIAKLGGT